MTISQQTNHRVNGTSSIAPPPAPRNNSQPTAVDARTDPAFKPPTTGTRAARYRKAANHVCCWDAAYDGMDRLQGLRHVVGRIKAELDVAEEDWPVLIARELPPYPRKPFTSEEIRDACRSGPAVIQSNGIAPRVALPPPDRKSTVRPLGVPHEEHEQKRDDVKLGRRGSTLTKKERRYFWEPWLLEGRYHIVVGREGTGKSTLMTYLMSLAKNPILLPGKEEDLDEDLLPRCEAMGMDPDKIIILDEGEWHMPEALPKLERQARLWGSNLILVDPLITYYPPTWLDNDYRAIRAYGESWAALGTRTGATVIGVFHPGKDVNNVLPGNRAWREVPRAVIELVKDAGPSGGRFLRSYKSSKAKSPSPQSYDIVEVPGCEAGRFQPGALLDEKAVALAKEVTDEVERSFIETALELLPAILRDGPVNSEKVYEIAEQHKLHPKVMLRAANRLGVKKDRGRGDERFLFFWSLPGCEDSSTPFDGTA